MIPQKRLSFRALMLTLSFFLDTLDRSSPKFTGYYSTVFAGHSNLEER